MRGWDVIRVREFCTSLHSFRLVNLNSVFRSLCNSSTSFSLGRTRISSAPTDRRTDNSARDSLPMSGQMPPKKIPLAKLTVMAKRKKGMSFEDFDKYWSENHGPLVTSLPIFKEKVIKYIQVHLDKAKMEELSTSKEFSLYNDFDGLMYAYAETVDDLMAVFQSDDYKNILIPDELKFIQREECKMFFGYEEVHWDRDDPSFSSSA